MKQETYGFKNINVDCMIGLPKQSFDEVKQIIEELIRLNPEHISVYSLIIEEGTRLDKMLREKVLELPCEELERIMYWYAKKTLEANNYNHYEISNFAKKGFESKHNLDCWNQKEYIGFGVSAHSYTNQCRYSNISNIMQYILNYKNNKQEDNIIIHEIQNKTSMAKEFIILSLRTIQGCSKENFYKKFGYDLEKGFSNKIEKLKLQGLIEINENSIILTEKGIDYANLVWEEFV